LKLDFLICASPTQGFFSQIAFFRLCLDALGGYYADARLVAVFGDHRSESIPRSWIKYFDNIQVEWAHPIGAENLCYRAQHDRRFEIMREDADLVFICDADIAPLAPFDSLLCELVNKPALAGTIAHYHFPFDNMISGPPVGWAELAKATIGKDIDMPFRYTLAPRSSPDRAPFYINYGMFAGTPKLMSKFYLRDKELRDPAASLIGDYWAAQVSVALACADLSLPVKVLPMRYNFPNDSVADQMYPEEMSNIIFLHYLRTSKFSREKIFSSRHHFNRFLNSRLSGSNEYFRRYVENLTGGKYPFARKPLLKWW